MPAPWSAYISFALAIFLFCPRLGHSRHMQAIRLAALLAAGVVSVNGLQLAAYLRSATHDLAITTLVAMVVAALVRLELLPAVAPRHRRELVAVFGLLALFLYPTALGLTYFDAYRFGYSPRTLIAVVAALTGLMLLSRNWVGAAMLTLATLGFTLGVHASPNYWDYLLDPFIALYCWGTMLASIMRALVGKLRTRNAVLEAPGIAVGDDISVHAMTLHGQPSLHSRAATLVATKHHPRSTDPIEAGQ